MDPSLTNRAAPPGSIRYFAALYAPEQLRDCVYAMYAIEAELRDSANSANHDVAHTRLRWWREEVERLRAGKPQHPASQILARAPLPPDPDVLQHLLFASEIELSRMTFDSQRELDGYLDRSGGALQESVAQVAHEEPLAESVRTQARRLGAIARHAEVLRSLRTEARAGRIYVPIQQLETARVAHNDLSADRPSSALTQLVATEAQRSLDAYRDTLKRLAKPDRARLRVVIVFATLQAKLLERLAKGGYTAQPLELGGFERSWTAWRTAVSAR